MLEGALRLDIFLLGQIWSITACAVYMSVSIGHLRVISYQGEVLVVWFRACSSHLSLHNTMQCVRWLCAGFYNTRYLQVCTTNLPFQCHCQMRSSAAAADSKSTRLSLPFMCFIESYKIVLWKKFPHHIAYIYIADFLLGPWP